jgi:hypothetical protein
MGNIIATPKAKPRRWGVVGFALALVVIVTFAVVPDLRPLVSTHSYSAQYSVSGKPYTDATVFSPLLMGHLLYLQLPSLADTPYSWFLVDLRRSVVSWPAGHYQSPFGYSYIYPNQAFGVPLTSGKMEDHWTVTFESDSVTFSNGTIHVAVHKRSD